MKPAELCTSTLKTHPSSSPRPPFYSSQCTSSSHFNIFPSSAFLFYLSHLTTSLFPPLRLSLAPPRLAPPRLAPPAPSLSLLTVTGNFASLPFCGGDKGGQCPLAGYVTGCHMRRTLWDGPALSAVTTQITSTASHLISTSNSISGN